MSYETPAPEPAPNPLILSLKEGRSSTFEAQDEGPGPIRTRSFPGNPSLILSLSKDEGRGAKAGPDVLPAHLGKIRDGQGGAAQRVEQAQAVEAQRRVVGIDRDLVEEASTGARSRAMARMAPSKSSRRRRPPPRLRPGPGPRRGPAPRAGRGARDRRGRRRPLPRPSSPRRAGCWRRGDSRPAGSCRPRCRGSGPSASTRRTIISRSSWPGSAKTASMRSCRAPLSRR